jgi:hypothetical protein
LAGTEGIDRKILCSSAFEIQRGEFSAQRISSSREGFMKTPPPASGIIWLEIAAFLTVIVISWVNELSGLESSLFGDTHTPNWIDPSIETVATILVAIPTIFFTWRFTKRLYYLEGFLRVCAWCQKVGEGDHWISIEEFAHKTLNTRMTHGICPTCSQKMKEGQIRSE